MIKNKNNILYLLYYFMALLFGSINASEQNTNAAIKFYNEIKEWSKSALLLNNNNTDILQKNYERSIDVTPLVSIRRLIDFIRSNSLAKNTDETNFTRNNPYEKYFLQKYIKSLLNTIPTKLTNSDLSSLKKYYAQLKNINEIHFKFVTQHILPNAIESLSNIQHNGYINSLEDCSQALLLFGTSEDLINEYFVYTELYDKSRKKSLEEQITCIIEKISKKIIYKANGQKAISERSIAENIQNNILTPLENIIGTLNNKGTDKATDSNPIVKPLKEINKTQTDLSSKAVTSDKESREQNKSKYNILDVNNLLALITNLISIQNEYKKIVADKKKLIKNIPQLCKDIDSWIKETTLTQIIPQSCNNQNISALLYNIRAELVKKYNEAKEIKDASTDNNNQPKQTAEQNPIQPSKQNNLNIEYDKMNIIVTNLSIKEPNQSIEKESTPESKTIQDEHVYEYDSAFNFFKNAYDIYEKLITPIYCQWAKEKKIDIDNETSLLKIINNIKSHINTHINKIKVYDQKEGNYLATILENASTINTLQLLYDSTFKNIDKLKKIYLSWASANALIVDSNELKSKSLEDISQEIQNALKTNINQIQKIKNKTELLKEIENKKTLSELSVFYQKIRKQINDEQQEAKAKLLNTVPTNKNSDLKNKPSSHVVAKQSWWSWLASWISFKTKNKLAKN